VADLANGRVAGELTKVVESGVPYQSITEYAESAGIDMIVMGTHGRTGLERALLGSVAEKTLRTASMPIVAVPPTANDTDDDALEFRYDDVLLPTDGSGAAERAVEWGIALTTANDATLHSIYSVISSEMFDFADVTDIGDALEQIGNQALNTIRERGERNDLTVETSLQRGAAAGTILSYAETNDVDMIVMGTHGRSGVTRYLIGSVTETVVRKAAVPVCCVPMDES
jgi:nucleotide-binding universal stress UspA family protein